MNPDEFCRWLQGFAELADARPSDAQWKSIREHLQTVFTKVTPPVEDKKLPTPKQTAELLRTMRTDSRGTRLC